MAEHRKRERGAWAGALVATALAVGCGGGGTGGPSGPPTYAVGGVVYADLSGGSMILRLNGAHDLTITHSGAFLFPTPLADGTAWTVTVLTPPANQDCLVTGGSGTIAAADATGVSVGCAVPTYTIGGTVSGLTRSPLLLQIDASYRSTPYGFGATIYADGPFAFSPLPRGSTWTVTVSAQPFPQTCAVTGGSGTLSGGPVTSVQVTCTP